MIEKSETEESLEFVLSVRESEIELVKRKIADGADLEGTGFGMTALYAAVFHGNLPMMQCLLDAGANPNHIVDSDVHTDTKHRTALNVACDASDVEAMNLLLDHGANPMILDEKGLTPLYMVIQSHHKILAQSNGQELLDALITRLLDAGARINQASELGQTALERALDRGLPSCTVALLLRRGADVERYDDFGKRPVHKAARAGNAEHIRLLVSHGANINATDNLERTALWEFKGGDAGLALLELGSALDWQDSGGATAIAARLNDLLTKDEVTPEIAVLINAGANLDLPDFRGETPRMIIERKRLGTIGAFVAARKARDAMHATIGRIRGDKP